MFRRTPYLGTLNASRAGLNHPLKSLQIIYRYTADWGNLCTTSVIIPPPPFYFLSQFKSKLQCGWHQWQKWNNCQRQALLEIFIFWGDLVSLLDHTAKTQYQKFETIIPRKGTARQQSQFLHSCFCERFILYIRTIGLSILLQANRWTKRGNIKIAQRLFRFLGIHKSKFLCSACSKLKKA